MFTMAVRDDFWAEAAERPAPPAWFPPAAAAAAIVPAIVMLDALPGLNVTLSVAAIGAALLPAVRHRLDAWRWTYAGLIAVLLLMPLVRAAPWLITLDVLAVATLGCLTLTGFSTWTSFVMSGVSVALRCLSAPAFLLRPLSRRLAGRPVGNLQPALVGGAIAGVLVIVFGALFASADEAFAELTTNVLVPDVDWGTLPPRLFVFGAALLLTGAGLYASLRPVAAPATQGARRLTRTEWLVPLVVLDLLFFVFVLVQLAVLFGGNEHVLETSGLTYAEYAREGFFQLVAVAVLTLAVIAAAVHTADLSDPADRRLARAALAALCLFTLVVLASALRRIGLYESAFGLTRLRISVHATILWLAVVFAMVLVAGALWRGDWLARAVVVSAAVTLVVLNLANPDALIARRAVERFQASATLDDYYLSSLSADAVPELLRLPGARACELLDAPPADASWSEYNRSRSRARELLLARGC